MSPPVKIDPVLALLDYLDAIRRSPRGWLLGGPSAVDDMDVLATGHASAVDLAFQYAWTLSPDRPLQWHQGRRLLLPPHTRLARIKRLFRDAWVKRNQGPPVTADTVEELLAAARMQGFDADAIARIEEATKDPTLSFVSKFPSRFRVRDLRASLVMAACVDCRLGLIYQRFWAVGLPDDWRGGLVDSEWKGATLPLPESLGGWLLLFGILGAPTLIRALVGPVDLGFFPWAAVPTLYLLALTLAPAGRRWLRRTTGAVATFLGYLWRSLTTRPAPEIALFGPSPTRSLGLYALFAHLAALAALHDPREGATVLGDTYTDLAALLSPGKLEYVWSATCRMQLGDALQCPKVARLTCVCGVPEGEPDDLVDRALGRAGAVWLVLSPEATPLRDCYVAAALAKLGPVPVAVLLDGGDPALLDRYPETRRELMRRPHRCRAVDLAGLRACYAAGQISPQEAAGFVRWLVGAQGAPSASAKAQERVCDDARDAHPAGEERPRAR